MTFCNDNRNLRFKGCKTVLVNLNRDGNIGQYSFEPDRSKNCTACRAHFSIGGATNCCVRDRGSACTGHTHLHSRLNKMDGTLTLLGEDGVGMAPSTASCPAGLEVKLPKGMEWSLLHDWLLTCLSTHMLVSGLCWAGRWMGSPGISPP